MIVYTGGTFDLLHAGHIKFLSHCRKIAGPEGKVVVSLNTDKFIKEYKGKPPVMTYDERKEALLGVKYVDSVVENKGGADSRPAISEVQPNAIVVGSDWAKKDYYAQMGFTQEYLDYYNITLIYVPYTEGISTTNVKSRLLEAPTFTAVIVAHQDEARMFDCINMIKLQTFKDVEILVYYSGMRYHNPPFDGKTYYFEQPNREDWGQEKCSHGLNAARGTYVGFFSIDDEYESNYIEKMVKKAREDELDLVYCDFISKEGTTVFGQPKLNIGTRGMFIIKSEVGRKVGYNHRDYGADGRFLEEVVATGIKHDRLSEVLYRHK